MSKAESPTGAALQQDRQPLNPERARVLAVEAIARTAKRAQDILGLRDEELPVSDAAAATERTRREQGEPAPIVTAAAAATEAAIDDQEVSLGRRAKTRATPAGPKQSSRSSSGVPVTQSGAPALSALETQAQTDAATQDTWIKSLMAAYEGVPDVAEHTAQLEALLGTTPADAILKGFEDRLASAQKVAEGAIAVSPSVKPKRRDVGAGVATPDAAPPQAAKVETGTGEWSKKKLHEMVADGERFTVTNAKGVTEYYRKGSSFRKKGSPEGEQSLPIMNALKRGDTFQLVSDATPVTPDITLSNAPVSPDVAVKPGSVEAGPTYAPGSFLEGKNHRAFFDGEGVLNLVRYVKNEYHVRSTDVLRKVSGEEAIRTLSIAEGWQDAILPATPAAPGMAEPLAGAEGEKKIGFQPMAPGASATYTSEKVKRPITVLRKGDFYYYGVDNQAQDNLARGFSVTEAQIQEIARNQRWILLGVDLSVLNEVVPGGMSPLKPEAGPKGWRPLADGKQALYVAIDGSSVNVERRGRTYTVYLGTDPGTEMTVEDIADLAKKEQWQYFSERDLVQPPAPTPGGPEQREKRSLAELKALVDANRLAYVTADYKQDSVWQKLRRVFGDNISKESREQDSRVTKENYERTLMEYRDAELAEIKASGLEGAPLRERMAQMLKYYQYDEKISLFNDRNQIKIENANWGQKGVLWAEHVGRMYNTLPRWAKLTLGGVVGVGMLAASFTGVGGVTLAAMSGAALAKRLVATCGLAVTVDTGIEMWQERGDLKKLEEQQKVNRRRLGGSDMEDPENMAKFEEHLEQEIHLLDEKFQKLKAQAVKRRRIVWGLAGVAMIGMSAATVVHSFSGAHSFDVKHPAVRLSETPASAAAAVHQATSTPVAAPSADAAASAAETAAQGAGEQVELAAHGAAVEALRENYTVTTDDGKGLWGILKDRLHLPSDTSLADENRMIQSLENAMRAKLDTMDPAGRAAAGFSRALDNGKVNLDFIRPNDHIDFEKLLTPEEIRSVMDGQSIAATQVAEAVSKAAGVVAEQVRNPMPGNGELSEYGQELAGEERVAQGVRGTPLQSVRTTAGGTFSGPSAREAALIHSPHIVTGSGGLSAREAALAPRGMPLDQTFAPRSLVMDSERGTLSAATGNLEQVSGLRNSADVLRYMNAHEELKPQFRLAAANIRASIFVNDALVQNGYGGGRFNYFSNRFMGGYNMMRVMTTPGMLHPTQMGEIVRLAQIAQDPRIFGMLGRPGNESINDWTMRLAAMATVSPEKGQLLSQLMASRM